MRETIELTLTARVPAGAARRTERALAVAAMFGLPLTPTADHVLFENVRLSIRPGDVVLITGPSGAGKSTLLRAIGQQLTARTEVRILRLADIDLPADRPLVDCFDAPLDAALAALARAGLSEARLLLRAPAELSKGEQFRYRLAKFFASDADILLADEFCATLDRLTARIVSWQLGKFIRASAAGPQTRAAVVATTHEDLADDLRPTVHLRKPLGDGVDTVQLPIAHCRLPIHASDAPSSPSAMGNGQWAMRPTVWEHVRIEPGTRADYAALRPFHYRSGPPGAVKRIFTACYQGPEGPLTAGVLVESLPALGCALRRIALPGRYECPDRQLAAALLNRDLRTISRVVVHPLFRGAGLAVALVRHLLEHAETPFVEALAAMGRVHPFFAKAGMRAYDRPPLPNALRLIAALAHEQLTPLHLIDLTPQRLTPFLRHELRRFARNKTGDAGDWLAEARLRLLSQPVYYLWSREQKREDTKKAEGVYGP